MRELAAETGVSHTTLASFANGATPQAGTIQRLEDWVERKGLLDSIDEERPEDAVYTPGEGEDEGRNEAEEMVADLPRVARYLRSFDGRPDAQVLRLAAVRAWGEVFALHGGYPDWFVALREKVERGEF